MLRQTKVFAVVLALGTIFGCGGSDLLGPTSGSGQETYTESVERLLDGGDVSGLAASTVNGEISLEGVSGGQVVVHIYKAVRAYSRQEAEAFARKVKVYAERRGNEIQIYREHPEPPNHIQVSVSYTIHSPSDVDARLNTVNGRISVRGIDGTVDAETINGAIDLTSDGGGLGLRTVNGDIDARVARLENEGRFLTVNGSIDVEIRGGTAPVTATATNGSVELTLPKGFSGQLDARSATGRVRSEFPMNLPPGNPENRLIGPLGEGGNTQIRLVTTHGNIDLRRW